MKLNCGSDSMLKAARRDRYLRNWHPFFALWPRRVGENDCRWLEVIERKGTYIQGCEFFGGFFTWKYRAKQ